MKTYKYIFPVAFFCFLFLQCKKAHDSPTDHLYVYYTNGTLVCRQYTRLTLSGDDSPKKKNEAFYLTSQNRSFYNTDYVLSLNFPSGGERATYFDGSGTSTTHVTMSITNRYGTWIPIKGLLMMNDHSTDPVPPFFARGRISFSNLVCIDTSNFYHPRDTLILSGVLKYY